MYGKFNFFTKHVSVDVTDIAIVNISSFSVSNFSHELILEACDTKNVSPCKDTVFGQMHSTNVKKINKLQETFKRSKFK